MIYFYLLVTFLTILRQRGIACMGNNNKQFATGPEDQGSIPGRVIQRTLKMVLDTSLLNTQWCKVYIKGKVEQSREKSNALPLHLGVVAIQKESLLVALDYGR